MKYCYIFGAGEYPDTIPTPDKRDITIACDAGYSKVLELGIEPTLILGDFDSLGTTPQGANVVKYPCVKDDTDMALAIKHGIELGATHFILYGALGERLDHTIANIHLLADLAEQGISAYIAGKHQHIVAVHNNKTVIAKQNIKYVSVFAWGGKAEGVTINGFKYNIENRTLSPSIPLGVSNEIVADRASVSVADGTLIVIIEH